MLNFRLKALGRVLPWLFLGIVLCGCGKPSKGKEDSSDDNVKYISEATPRQILLMGIGPDPETLDPQLASGVTELNIARALFEGLVVPDPKDLSPQPGTALSWKISEDQRVYTFSLRQDAKWSNGDPVLADDFVFAYKRMLSPMLGSPTVSMFFILENAEQYYRTPSIGFDKVGIKALDPHTLQLTLAEPNANFLARLLHPAWSPLNAKAIAACGALDQRDNAWTRPGNLVCNGAFSVKSRHVGDKIIAVKNTYYHGAAQVKLRAIHFLAIPNYNTEERLFRDNQLHITENVPYPQIMLHYNQHSPYLKISAYLGTFYYVYNTTRPPFNDARVRKALAMVLDRKKISGVDRVPCKNKPAYNLIPEGTGGDFHSIHCVSEDINEAKRLLAEAGYADGKGFPKVTLLFNTAEGQRFIAEAAQEMWKKHLGIDIQLMNQEWKVLLSTRKSQDFDIIRGSWVADYNDPETFLGQWLSISPGNYSGWKDATFDATVEKARRELDPAKRLALFQEAEGKLMEAMPFIPIHSSNTSHLVHSSVQGWFPNLLDWHSYTCMFLKP